MFEFGTQYFPFDRKSFVLGSDQFNLTPDNHVREHIQVGLQGVESRWNYRHWNPWFNWKQHRWFVQTVFLRINIKGQIAKCLRNEAKIIHIYWSFFCEFSLTVMVFSLTHFRPVFHNPCHTPWKTSKYRNRTLTRNELRMVLLISGVFYRNITLSLNLIS